MPIYQYNCAGCHKRVEVFLRHIDPTAKPACPECGSKRLARVMSAFARGRTARQRIEEIDQTAVSARLQQNNVGEFARWARRDGAQWDEELGTNYRELAERAEAGDVKWEHIDADHGFRARAGERLRQLGRNESAPPAADPWDAAHGAADGHGH
jgi:putative FmdB family regulatory protein